jgi:hypothetical protein
MTINKSNWKNIGHITMALFILVSIGAFIAFTYSEMTNLGNLGVTFVTIYPYQPYAIVLAICGIISAVISIGSYVASKYLLVELISLSIVTTRKRKISQVTSWLN